MRICIFGGTFDPIHLGHLIVAEYVREELEIDQMFFVPSHIPPHKTKLKITDATLRLTMTNLAIRTNPGFHVSPIEIEINDISYTVNTIKFFHAKLKTSVSQTFLLIGADSLLDIHTWYNPDEIFQIANVVVVCRPGYSLNNVNSSYLKNTIQVKTPLIDISSTEIRDRVKKGLSIHYLVPEAVAQFIKDQNLYR